MQLRFIIWRRDGLFLVFILSQRCQQWKPSWGKHYDTLEQTGHNRVWSFLTLSISQNELIPKTSLIGNWHLHWYLTEVPHHGFVVLDFVSPISFISQTFKLAHLGIHTFRNWASSWRIWVCVSRSLQRWRQSLESFTHPVLLTMKSLNVFCVFRSVDVNWNQNPSHSEFNISPHPGPMFTSTSGRRCSRCSSNSFSCWRKDGSPSTVTVCDKNMATIWTQTFGLSWMSSNATFLLLYILAS